MFLELYTILQKNLKVVKYFDSNNSRTEPITLSFGISSKVPDNTFTPESLIKNADVALYKAKDNGRNRIIIDE